MWKCKCGEYMASNQVTFDEKHDGCGLVVEPVEFTLLEDQRHVYSDNFGAYWFGTEYEAILGPYDTAEKAIDAFKKYCFELEAEGSDSDEGN